jgi:hypothetical protein
LFTEREKMKNEPRVLSIALLVGLIMVSISCSTLTPLSGNSQAPENKSTPLVNPLAETVIPAATATAKIEATSTEFIEPTPTVYGVRNPSGIILAGTPVISGDYWMVVDKSGMEVDSGFIGFSIQLKVLGEDSHLFRYNASSIHLSDDLGNIYDYEYGGYRCTESDIFTAKQIQVNPGDKVVIEPQTSMEFTSYFWWCTEGYDNIIPGFNATVPADAKSLFLEFSDFGPFTGFSYEFDL